MTKVKVFIDFEAISAPFSYKLKIKDDFPYAYSLGIHVGKKFKVKTTIIRMIQVSEDSVYEYIRLDIIDKIKELLGKKDFKVNKDTIEFIGWAPNLEKKILSKAFKGIKVTDQTKGYSVSLSYMTKEFEDDYFKEFRKAVNNTLDKDFIERRGLDHDGSLAALAGHELYRQSRGISNKFDISIDNRTLLKEIVAYSKDDVKRMSWLYLNPNEYSKRIKVHKEVKAEISKISANISLLRKVNSFLTNVDKDLDVKSLLKNIDEDIKDLNEQRDFLKKK